MQDLHVLGTESFIHRLSPITKLLAVVLFWLAALMTFDLVPLGALIVVGLIIWVIGKINIRSIIPIISPTAGIAVFMIGFNGFSFWNGKTALFTLPVLGWEFWKEGALFGLGIAMKIFAVVTIVPLLTQTTPMPRLLAGLAKLKLPYKICFTLGMAFRLIPLIGTCYKDITEAQTLRGHDLKRMKIIPKITKGFIPLFIPLTLTLLRRSGDLDIAIESRGFGAPVERSFLVDISLTWRDWVFLAFFALAFAGIMYLVFTGGLTQEDLTYAT
jgi:energy-coupling factor transport system permease protein